MKYGVSVDLRLPAGSPRLDPLQSEGAVSLLDRLLDPIGIFEAAGAGVALESHAVAAHPDGALVLLVAEATSLEVAETGVRQLLIEILQRSELLASWEVARCEVGFDERFAEADLWAPNGPDQPPPDLVERTRWHADQRRQGAPKPADPDDESGWRTWVMGQTELVRAFGPEDFGGATADDSVRLAAGALVAASTFTIDLLLEDIAALSDGAVAGSGDVFFVLDALPERFADQYNGRFARRFLAATIMITGRLTAEQWSPPASHAEALALQIVIEQARNLLIDHGVVDEDEARDLYAGFEDAAFDDTDHEWFYETKAAPGEGDFESLIGAPADSWFRQFPDAKASVHPFTVDSDPREDGE